MSHLGYGSNLCALDEIGESGVGNVAADLVRASAHHLRNKCWISGRKTGEEIIALGRASVVCG